MELNRTLKLLLLSFLFLLLTSCGIPDPPDESQIKQDLSSETFSFELARHYFYEGEDTYDFYPENYSIAIDKRQTNEKSDLVYCQLQMNDSIYQVTKFLRLAYVYYDDGGWILENVEEYQDPAFLFLDFPLDPDTMVEKYLNIIGQRDKWDVNGDLEISASCSDSEILDGGTQCRYTLQVDKVYPYCTLDETLDIFFRFGDYSAPNSIWAEIGNYHISSDWSNLCGNWRRRGVEPDDPDNVSLSLESFDPENLTASGTCTFSYVDGLETSPYARRYKHVCSLKDADIKKLDGEYDNSYTNESYNWEISCFDAEGTYAGKILLGRADSYAYYDPSIRDNVYGGIWSGRMEKIS